MSSSFNRSAGARKSGIERLLAPRTALSHGTMLPLNSISHIAKQFAIDFVRLDERGHLSTSRPTRSRATRLLSHRFSLPRRRHPSPPPWTGFPRNMSTRLPTVKPFTSSTTESQLCARQHQRKPLHILCAHAACAACAQGLAMASPPGRLLGPARAATPDSDTPHLHASHNRQPDPTRVEAACLPLPSTFPRRGHRPSRGPGTPCSPAGKPPSRPTLQQAPLTFNLTTRFCSSSTSANEPLRSSQTAPLSPLMSLRIHHVERGHVLGGWRGQQAVRVSTTAP